MKSAKEQDDLKKECIDFRKRIATFVTTNKRYL